MIELLKSDVKTIKDEHLERRHFNVFVKDSDNYVIRKASKYQPMHFSCVKLKSYVI